MKPLQHSAESSSLGGIFPGFGRDLFFVLLLGLILLIVGLPAEAKGIAQATDGTSTVTLYDDKCALPAVSNLPFRATWSEHGKTTEGCFTIMGPIVVMYFEVDRTVALAGAENFHKLTGI